MKRQPGVEPLARSRTALSRGRGAPLCPAAEWRVAAAPALARVRPAPSVRRQPPASGSWCPAPRVPGPVPLACPVRTSAPTPPPIKAPGIPRVVGPRPPAPPRPPVRCRSVLRRPAVGRSVAGRLPWGVVPWAFLGCGFGFGCLCGGGGLVRVGGCGGACSAGSGSGGSAPCGGGVSCVCSGGCGGGVPACVVFVRRVCGECVGVPGFGFWQYGVFAVLRPNLASRVL